MSAPPSVVLSGSHLRRRVLGTAILTGVLAVATMATACRKPPPACPTEAHPGLAIAAGGRQNSPTPVIGDQIDKAIDAAIDARKAITMIRVDGRPSIACSLTYSSSAANPEAQADDRRRFRALVNSIVGGMRAREPEADPLGALSQAAAVAQPRGTVVLIDSGLQTVAPLNFRVEGLLDANPDEVVSELSKLGLLPDLHSRNVILSGIGYTSAPQASLDQKRRSNLIQIWTKIVEAAGAVKPVIVDTPNTAESVPDVPSVSLVPVPPPPTIKLGCNTQSILADDGKVGFVPDSTEFIDPAGAEETLRPLADWLKNNKQAHVDLVGNIAHVIPDPGDGGLARARAERVREELIRAGAPAGQISARGDGWGPFPSKTAPPSAVYNQRNRRVVVTITCS